MPLLIKKLSVKDAYNFSIKVFQFEYIHNNLQQSLWKGKSTLEQRKTKIGYPLP